MVKGDIVVRNGKKYVVEDIVKYDFGICPVMRLLGETEEVPTVVEKVSEIKADEVTDYESLGIKQLQEICKAKGLPIRGSKAEVIDRLKGVR